MNYSLIRTDVRERIGYIILSRPEKKNALNDQMVKELLAALREFEEDPAVKVILLKADGDVFSAGADLEYLQKLQGFSFEENLADSGQLRDLFFKIYTHPRVIVSCVQGHALAGGCGLATICDFCFAVPDAKFGYTEVKIGFIPALVSVFLVRKISGVKARELLLTGKLITAHEAAQTGLINEVIPKERIEEYVQHFCEALCREASSQSLTYTKQLLARISSMETEPALNYAAEMNAHARGGEDCKKGIDDFLKKKKTTW